jgi:hypothetical protein
MKISLATQLIMKATANASGRKLHKLSSSGCRSEFKKTNKIGTKKYAGHAHSH